MDDKSRVQAILDASENLVLATADKDGKPWVTPVSYSCDQDYCLYWTSSKDSRHSSNIRDRREVAIVIYSLKPVRDALYIESEAEELADEAAIVSAIEVINRRAQPAKYRLATTQDVSGEASWRLYKATPKAVYLREESTVRGQAIAVRRQIKL